MMIYRTTMEPVMGRTFSYLLGTPASKFHRVAGSGKRALGACEGIPVILANGVAHLFDNWKLLILVVGLRDYSEKMDKALCYSLARVHSLWEKCTTSAEYKIQSIGRCHGIWHFQKMEKKKTLEMIMTNRVDVCSSCLWCLVVFPFQVCCFQASMLASIWFVT